MKNIHNIDTNSYKRSFVIGTLLGDASSRRRDSRNGMRAAYTITHSGAQADFVVWKAQEFERLYQIQLNIHHDLERNRVSFYLSSGQRLRIIHDWFHRDSKKVITDKIRFMDHPIGLATLLCDDGSIQKQKKTHVDGSIYYLKPTITIATHCFDKDSVERLLAHINYLYGAYGYINPERRWRNGERKEYNRIHFNATHSRTMWEHVRQWIPHVPSMLSKFSYAIECYGLE